MNKKLSLFVLLSMMACAPSAYSAEGCCCQSCICPPGPPGPVGPCCPVNGVFTGVYSLTAQTIPPGGNAILDLVAQTTSEFDLSQAGTTGVITILKSGIYFINWGVDGRLAPPYPSPVPAWSFAAYRNGVLLPGTSSGSFSITPDDICTHDSGLSIILLQAGDTVTLVNTSTKDFEATSNILGSTIPVASTRLNLILLTAL